MERKFWSCIIKLEFLKLLKSSKYWGFNRADVRALVYFDRVVIPMQILITNSQSNDNYVKKDITSGPAKAIEST